MTPVPATTAGIAQFFTVTAFDAFGNRSTVYTGTAVFGSSDVQAGLPAAYTFTAADGGTHTFGVTMRTAGSQSLTVRDWGGSATGTQTGIVVTSAAPVSLSVTQLHGGVAGVAQPLTVTARDAFGNVATGYRGTVTFATSDTIASIPATYTFTATDAGTHTFSVTFKSSGGQTFAVQDTVNTTWGGSQRDIN